MEFRDCGDTSLHLKFSEDIDLACRIGHMAGQHLCTGIIDNNPLTKIVIIRVCTVRVVKVLLPFVIIGKFHTMDNCLCSHKHTVAVGKVYMVGYHRVGYRHVVGHYVTLL